jgi:hypothetical protein
LRSRGRWCPPARRPRATTRPFYILVETEADTSNRTVCGWCLDRIGEEAGEDTTVHLTILRAPDNTCEVCDYQVDVCAVRTCDEWADNVGPLDILLCEGHYTRPSESDPL